jgi:hypothetical protein
MTGGNASGRVSNNNPNKFLRHNKKVVQTKVGLGLFIPHLIPFT